MRLRLPFIAVVASSAVIHTVGPMGVNPQALSNCYEKSLSLLVENNLKSIVSLERVFLIVMVFFKKKCIPSLQAFPCISTGVYGYPSTEACPVALKSVREFLVKHHSKVHSRRSYDTAITHNNIFRWTESCSACFWTKILKFMRSRCNCISRCPRMPNLLRLQNVTARKMQISFFCVSSRVCYHLCW